LGTAPELVIETKPPEQDLDFTGSFHSADSTNREQFGKPLGIGGLMSEVPNPQEPTGRLSVDSWLPVLPPIAGLEKKPHWVGGLGVLCTGAV
jgi:hypothetical protein